MTSRTAPAKKFECPVSVDGVSDQRCPDGCCGDIVVDLVRITSPKTGRTLVVTSADFNEVMSRGLVCPHNVAGEIPARKLTTMSFTVEQLKALYDRPRYMVLRAQDYSEKDREDLLQDYSDSYKDRRNFRPDLSALRAAPIAVVVERLNSLLAEPFAD